MLWYGELRHLRDHTQHVAKTRQMSARVVAAYTQAFWETAAELGLSRAALWQTAMIEQSADDVTPLQYMQLLNAAAKLSGDRYFGLRLGQHLRLPHYAVYGVGLLSCRDFREAVAQVIRYESLAHDLGRSSIIEAQAQAQYHWHSPWLNELPCPYLVESIFVGIVVFVRWLMNAPVRAQSVHFMHAAPEADSHFQQIFDCPVVFNAPFHGIVFDRELLDVPLPNADPSVRNALIQHAESLLAARAQQSAPALLRELRVALTEGLARGDAKLSAIAKGMGMSSRNLQRALEKRQTNFQQELNRCRHVLAQRYMADSTLSLTEIAFLLGYSEQSAFTHAFKEWEGVSPTAWRAQHQLIR